MNEIKFLESIDGTDLRKVLIVGEGVIGCAMIADHRARETIAEMGHQIIVGEVPTKTEIEYMPCYLQNGMQVFAEPVLDNLPDKSWYRKFERKSKRIK